MVAESRIPAMAPTVQAAANSGRPIAAIIRHFDDGGNL
jgi:hypothetical protein